MISRDCLWDCIGDADNQVLRLISQADLHALCLVSKASRAATEPALYSRIELTWEQDRLPPITAFLRTIIRRAELADHVRSVVLRGTFCYKHAFSRPPPLIPVELDLKEADQAIEKTKVQFAARWKQDIRRGVMDAFVALMLSQLHYITCLELDRIFVKETELLGMLLRSALCEKSGHGIPTFQSLHKVTHETASCSRDKMCGRHTADVLPYFYLPDLRSLSTSLDNPIKVSWPTPTPNNSTIASLYLTDIRETQLGQLLSATKGLKTLTWDWHYKPDNEHSSNTCVLNLNELATALSPVRATLKELKISACCFEGMGTHGKPLLDIRGSPDDLVGLDQLEKLEIPLPLLLSLRPDNEIRLQDVVPRNIQALIINDDLYQFSLDPFELYRLDVKALAVDFSWENMWEDTHLFDAIELWLRSWRTSHPRLRTITVSLKLSEIEWLPDMREKLTRLGDQRGVKTVVVRQVERGF